MFFNSDLATSDRVDEVLPLLQQYTVVSRTQIITSNNINKRNQGRGLGFFFGATAALKLINKKKMYSYSSSCFFIHTTVFYSYF